jgi:hypothetical protein
MARRAATGGGGGGGGGGGFAGLCASAAAQTSMAPGPAGPPWSRATVAWLELQVGRGAALHQ